MRLPVQRRHLVFAGSGLMAAVLLTSLLWRLSVSGIFHPKHETILQLQQLPVGSYVHLHGLVTYADPAGKRFWIQDDTGAIAVDEDPRRYGLRAGQSVILRGTKIRPYNSAAGPTSIGLKNVEAAPTMMLFELPPPVAVSLKTFPDKEKNGIRIRLNGVIRRVQGDDQGHMQLVLGDAGQEVPATLSEGKNDVSEWTNARVSIVGVGESIYNDKGALTGKRIWIQKTDDIRVEKSAPSQTPVYTIRTLYSDAHARGGHKVRIQGMVAMQPTTDSLLLEDRWGSIACAFDRPTAVAVGTTVELTGFPTVDGHGLRIDLLHSSLTTTSAQVSDNDQKEDPGELTTVTSVRELGEAEANSALAVRVTGIVTYNDPDWKQMFLQDATGGMYVKYAGSPVALAQGQRVTVIGITNAGDYAPVIIAPKFIVHGKAPLPRAVPLTAGEASSGTLDSQFVEVDGVIHPMKTDEDSQHPTFELFSSFGQIHVYTDPAFSRHVRKLEDATVRMRGVLGTLFNSRRQLVGYQLSVSSDEDVEVLQPASVDPFRETAILMGSLLRFSPRADFRHRVKVKGAVTMIGHGFFYMQDDSGGLEIQSDTNSLRRADLVEAVGYVSPGGGYSPIMTDATVNVVGHDVPVSARSVTSESVLQGQFDSQVIAIDGRLLSVVDSFEGRSLVLQAGAVTFNAQFDSPEASQLPLQLQEGSVLRLTGVCSSQVDPNRLYQLKGQPPLSFRLLLNSNRDVEVLRAAPWWSIRHAVAVFGLLFAVIFSALVWVTVLRRRVRGQTQALLRAQEKAEAIGHLARVMQDVSVLNDFTERVPVSGCDEIAQLGVGFNKMLAELNQRDVAKIAAERKLQNLAVTDELTGLPNRRLLSDRLAQSLAIAKRERHIVAILYLDLDGFKLVNDTFGHTMGDVLLEQVAQRLRSRIRESDTLARIGGDEFTVLLTRLRTREEAGQVGRALLDVLAEKFDIDNHEIRIGASIGISLFPDDATDGASLLQLADSAMYAAKRNGRNLVMEYTADLGSSIHERLSLETQLRGAVARGEVHLHYQPEFDASSRRLVRFEALARWFHPTLGTVPPDKFIPIAEESGLIITLGAYVMERACEAAVKWQALAPSPIQVAVNVSSLQFARPTFVKEVAEILRRTGLQPALLQIELTESIMLSGPEQAGEVMKKLHALGVTLAIDDFGTGYSCLSYLPRLPFDALKIDRSFVNELTTRPEMRAMVRSLVTLSHELKMQVIVEGIETLPQLELVKELGGNEVQGYLLGRPTANPESHLCGERSETESADFQEAPSTEFNESLAGRLRILPYAGGN